MLNTHVVGALFFAMVSLSEGEADQSRVDLPFLSTLPPPESPLLHCIFTSATGYANVRVLIGEVLEQQGRFEDALVWAQAELQVS